MKPNYAATKEISWFFSLRCQLFVIWATLFFTSLTPNIALAFGDIFSDAFLVIQYYDDMRNQTHVEMQEDECQRLRGESPIPLQVQQIAIVSIQ